MSIQKCVNDINVGYILMYVATGFIFTLQHCCSGEWPFGWQQNTTMKFCVMISSQ